MPKATTQPAKLFLILSYFHKSGVAHSIKDLEKALPSVASINGMQVKDYLQSLADESRIKVEKIGSGNWYWAFAGEERAVKEKMRQRCEEERDVIAGQVGELEDKIEERIRARQEGEEEGGGVEGGRKGMMERVEVLTGEVEALRKELEGYSGNDPVALEGKRREIEVKKMRASQWTEHVWAMEGYLRDELGLGREGLEGLKRQIYEGEYDEDEGGLAEIVL